MDPEGSDGRRPWLFAWWRRPPFERPGDRSPSFSWMTFSPSWIRGGARRILSLMEEEETGQVLLTVPKESDIRLRRDSLPRWRIREGALEW